MRASSRIFLLLIALSVATVRAEQLDLDKATASLVEAEKGYAKLGAEKGFRAASLSNLSDDAVIFAPRMTNGKKFWQEAKEDPFITWRPSFASIARSAELGYTTGPSEYRNARGDKEPAAFGHFVSIWRKDAQGTWKVVVDVGVNHPQPPQAKAEVTTSVPKLPLAHPESASADFQKTRVAFVDSLKKDEGATILASASEDIRVYRRGAIPLVGKTAAKEMLGSEHGKTSRMRSGGGISKANDLAYEYGDYESDHNGAPVRGIYFCIWQLASEGDWKLVLDLQKNAPPEKK